MEIVTRFILVGGYAGQTINLGGHNFVEGVFEYGPNPDGVIPSEEERRLKADYLAKCYQAYPEGSQAHADELERLGLELPESPGISVPEREAAEQQKAGEQATTSRARQGAVRTALAKLDPKDDSHWTSAGLPSVEAVRALAGQDDISRDDIKQLAPNLTRDEAKKVAAEKDPLD